MEKKNIFNITLAIVGTLLVWYPVLATIALSVEGSIAAHILRVDYLMPAEYFPPAFAGAVLLLWAAFRASSHRRWLAWGLGLIVGFWVGGQVLAIATGLAWGSANPEGLAWVLVLASIAFYTMALIGTGVAGVSFLRFLFK